MYLDTEIADKYQEFFNFMSQEHDLTLTISEMDEIVSEAQKLVKKLAIPHVGQSSRDDLLIDYAAKVFVDSAKSKYHDHPLMKDIRDSQLSSFRAGAKYVRNLYEGC
jgi:hypothetical protein